jgi:hypothetical protein
MYEVEEHRWIKIASMYLNDAAARWFQSVEPKLYHASWGNFVVLLLEHFGREQKKLLIRQLFHDQQTGTVAEYVERFSELVDQLSAYGHVVDPVYYAMRFIDGLRPDIRAVLTLHRPSNFASAAALAMLQDDVGGQAKSSKKYDSFYGSCQAPRGPLPLPPLLKLIKLQLQCYLRKRLCDGKSLEERMAALRAYRKAKGMCIRCAEKWHKEHKCSPTVQLHVVQELLELFQLDDMEQLSIACEQSYQLFVAISTEALTRKESPQTMCFEGLLQGKSIQILVDSGSTHTFINQRLACSIACNQRQESHVKVQIANRGILHCSSVLTDVEWSVEGYKFVSHLKVLPLGHFDMILGMDWLESFSPMQVHWRHKWMAIPYQGSTAVL